MTPRFHDTHNAQSNCFPICLVSISPTRIKVEIEVGGYSAMVSFASHAHSERELHELIGTLFDPRSTRSMRSCFECTPVLA